MHFPQWYTCCRLIFSLFCASGSLSDAVKQSNTTQPRSNLFLSLF